MRHLGVPLPVDRLPSQMCVLGKKCWGAQVRWWHHHFHRLSPKCATGCKSPPRLWPAPLPMGSHGAHTHTAHTVTHCSHYSHTAPKLTHTLLTHTVHSAHSIFGHHHICTVTDAHWPAGTDPARNCPKEIYDAPWLPPLQSRTTPFLCSALIWNQ